MGLHFENRVLGCLPILRWKFVSACLSKDISLFLASINKGEWLGCNWHKQILELYEYNFGVSYLHRNGYKRWAPKWSKMRPVYWMTIYFFSLLVYGMCVVCEYTIWLLGSLKTHFHEAMWFSWIIAIYTICHWTMLHFPLIYHNFKYCCFSLYATDCMKLCNVSFFFFLALLSLEPKSVML